ncbi:hypothetical protein [Marinomonas sp. PE14-40]|uniref:hypothetical protein n=1 Tax=Marinomonas sp. PE14-40 TaxID=3060621 RepID=UPI003F672FE2
MFNLNFKLVSSIFLAISLVGCNTVEEKPSEPANIFDELELKVSVAKAAKSNSSSWSDPDVKGIKLVGPIYQTGFEKRSSATKALAKVLQYIESNPNKLPQLTERSLSEQFTNFSVSDFVLGDNEFSYIPAVFNVGYGDEAALNAVLNIVLEANGPAEIGFYIDAQAWQKDIISLQGYKSIKANGKERNSTWYHYRLNLEGQDSKAKVDALLRMSLYAIGSDIREFASIDRDAVMKFNDKDYVVERANGDTFAFVYQDRIKLIEKEIERKIDSLDKERLLNNTANARSLFIDANESYATVNTLTDYVSRVSLLSLKNANQVRPLWESKQWDEYAKHAYFLPKQNLSIILTDKNLIIKQEDMIKLKQDATNLTSLNVLENRNKIFYVNKGTAYVLDLTSYDEKAIKTLGVVNQLAVSQDAKSLYSLSKDNTLSYFDAKNQRLTQLKKSLELTSMQVCASGKKLLYWHKNKAYLYDNQTQSHHSIQFSTELNEDLIAAKCAVAENKLLLMTESGGIRQIDTDTYQQITQFSGSYDAYDKLNSGYVVHYLSENEFVYGGKNDLRIRPTTTETEIRRVYQKRLERIESARSWLDKSSIKQLVFAEAIPSSDLALYESLFDEQVITQAQKNAYLSFINEEQADPLLVANKPSLFNALSGGIDVVEDGNIMLVKQNEVDASRFFTTSQPNWDHLGFQVDTLYLGTEGFESKIYRQLDNSQLTADIVNMDLGDDDWLVTSLTNGEISLESLSSEVEFNETFDAHDGAVTATAMTGDRKRLATAGRDGLIKVWHLNIPPGEDESWVSLEKELKGYAGHVLDLEFVNDSLLLSTGTDQTIKLWELSLEGTVKNEMLGHTDSVRFAKYDASIHKVVSASNDASVRVWDIDKAEQVKSFKGSKGGLVRYDVSSNRLAYVKGNHVIIKNIVSGDTLGSIAIEQNPVGLELGFNGVVSYLIYEDRVAVYKVATGELINTISLVDVKNIRQVFTSPNDHDLFIVTDQEAYMLNMGRYALYGIEDVNE